MCHFNQRCQHFKASHKSSPRVINDSIAPIPTQFNWHNIMNHFIYIHQFPSIFADLFSFFAKWIAGWGASVNSVTQPRNKANSFWHPRFKVTTQCVTYCERKQRRKKGDNFRWCPLLSIAQGIYITLAKRGVGESGKFGGLL